MATAARQAQQQALEVARGLAVSGGGYRVLRKPESERQDYTVYKLQVTPRPGSAVCGGRGKCGNGGSTHDEAA